MTRTVAVVGIVLLMILWPAATVGMAGPAGDGASPDEGPSSSVAEHPSVSADGSADRGHGKETDRSRDNDAESAGSRHVHRDRTEPSLVTANTTLDGDPAVDEPTTVTLTMTAITDVSNLSVTLPDYHFVAGDGQAFTVGDLTEGDTRTVEVTVRPMEAIAKHLQFTITGITEAGPRRQQVSQDLAVVDRSNTSSGLAVDATRPSDSSIPDTTTDPTGSRAPGSDSHGDSTSGQVTGCFSYEDQDGNLHDGRQLEVAVMDSDTVGEDHPIAFGQTLDSGCFNVEVQDPSTADRFDNDAEVYVLIYADNPAGKATSGALRHTYKVRFPGGDETLERGGHVSLTSGNRIIPSTEDPAFEAVDIGLDVRRFFDSQADFTRDPIRFQYPKSDWPTYHPVGEHIELPDRSTRDWGRDTIVHEYAHGMMDAMYGDESNGPDKCPDQVTPGCIDKHEVYSETYSGYALVEGWAEFVEGAILGPGAVAKVGGDLETNEWFNTSIPDSTKNGDVTPGADTGDMDGNSVEGSVASILFDIYDPVSSADQIDADLTEIVDTVENNNPQSIKGFLDDWSHGSDEALAIRAFHYGVPIGDPYEPNGKFSSASRIGMQTINATVGSGVDYYQLTVPSQREVTVELEDIYSLSGVDVDLVAYDATQSQIDSSTGPTNSESVTLPPTGRSAKTFYIKVTSSGGSASYELNVTGSFNPKLYLNTPTQTVAGALSASPSTQVQMADGDNVSYAVQLRADERLNVSAASDAEVDLSLYNFELPLSRTAPAGEPLRFVAPANGTYFIEATATTDEPTTVSLAAATALPGNDRFEPNDDLANALPIWPGDFAGLRLDETDEDHYPIALEDGQKLSADATGVAMNGSIEVAIVSPEGETLATDASDDVASVSNLAETPGLYVVRVQGVDSSAGSYGLSVVVETPNNDAAEPNDDTATAAPLPMGTTEELQITTGDRDVFAVELADNEQLSVSLGFDQGDGDLDLRLFGPSGELIDASASDTDNETASLEANGSGTHFVDVRGRQGGAAQYTLEAVTEALDGNDRFEPNDGANPTSLEPGTYEELRIIDDDRDGFSVGLSAGETLDVTATFDHDDGNLDLAVYGPDNRSVASSFSMNDDESVTHTAEQGGTYTVVVSSSSNASASYDLSLSVTAPMPTVAWPTFQSDAQRTGYAPDTTGPVTDVSEQWGVETGPTLASPAVANGSVYAGTDRGVVYALAADSGAERWTAETDGIVRSAPAVADGRVYVTTRNGTLYAFDASDGRQAWRVTTPGSITNLPAALSSPAVVDETVIFGSVNGRVYAVDAATGAVQWEFETGAAIYASPAVADGTAYIADSNGTVYALASGTGALQWEAPITPGSRIGSSPAVAGGTVYIGTWAGDVYALAAADGMTEWTYDAGAPVLSSPAVADGRVFVGSLFVGSASPGTLHAIAAADGTGVWRVQTGADVASSPAVTADTVYVGDDSSTMYAVAASDGRERWRLNTGGDDSVFDEITGSPAVVGETVYVTDGTTSQVGGVYALAESEQSGGDNPVVVGNSPATNVDEDPYLEDVDGDGEFSIGDVQIFFQNRDVAVVQDNAELFDFSGTDPDEVTIGDVQALFQEFQEHG